MGEFEFIGKIKRMFVGVGAMDGMEGIGDDCAVIPMDAGRSMVLTTDMLIEGSHFLRAATSPEEIGRKSLSVNLSDVAAMGARPVAALLSLGLPKECVGEWAERFMEGLHEQARRFGVALIGGDTTASCAGVVVNVVAIGMAGNAQIKRRGDARPGDRIAVAGRLGESAAGLKRILAGDYASPLARAHNDPRPQVAEGLWLGGRTEVHAMIDLSDGLASDLMHVLNASGVGAGVALEAIPTDHTLEDALTGGEDYKLLFTFAPGTDFEDRYREQVGELYVIGKIMDGPSRIEWTRNGRPVAGEWKGFTHF